MKMGVLSTNFRFGIIYVTYLKDFENLRSIIKLLIFNNKLGWDGIRHPDNANILVHHNSFLRFRV